MVQRAGELSSVHSAKALVQSKLRMLMPNSYSRILLALVRLTILGPLSCRMK